MIYKFYYWLYQIKKRHELLIPNKGENLFSATCIDLVKAIIGTLENGVHIVRVYESSTDVTGVYSTLLFFGFTQNKIDLDGQLNDQLILHLIKSYCFDDKIVVTAKSVLIDKPCKCEIPVEVFE